MHQQILKLNLFKFTHLYSICIHLLYYRNNVGSHAEGSYFKKYIIIKAYVIGFEVLVQVAKGGLIRMRLFNNIPIGFYVIVYRKSGLEISA